MKWPLLLVAYKTVSYYSSNCKVVYLEWDTNEKRQSITLRRSAVVNDLFAIKEKSVLKKILIVDDDIGFLQLMSSILKKHFEVFETSGVQEALKVVESVLLDAICSDFNMRDGTGLELLMTLRQKGIKTPFLLMSGSDDQQLERSAQKYGAVFCCKTDYELMSKIKGLATGKMGYNLSC